METIEKLSLRVYGCCVLEGKVLLLRESYAGEVVVKFPGGGLELGEGIKDCLQREILEELGVAAAVHQAVYTVDYFLRSAFHPNTQIILMYYAISFPQGLPLQALERDAELFWADLSALGNPLSLESDRRVYEKLKG